MAQHVAETTRRLIDAGGTMGGSTDPASGFASMDDPSGVPAGGCRQRAPAHLLARDGVACDRPRRTSEGDAAVRDAGRMARTLSRVHSPKLDGVGSVEPDAGRAGTGHSGGGHRAGRPPAWIER